MIYDCYHELFIKIGLNQERGILHGMYLFLNCKNVGITPKS